MFLPLLIILGCLLPNTGAYFEEIVTLAEKVYNEKDLTAQDAEEVLEEASEIIEKAVADNYMYLHDTLIELSSLVENIVSKFEASPPKMTDMEEVVRDLMILNENTLHAIRNLTCGYDQTSCTLSEQQAKRLVNDTESKLLRSVKIIVSPNKKRDKRIPQTNLKELQAGNTTLTCVRSLDKDVANMINRYSKVLNIPFVGKNDSYFKNQEVYFYNLAYKHNLYKFVKNQYSVNSGTAKTFIEDMNGNYLELFGDSDEIKMEVDFTNELNDPSFWKNITHVDNNNNDDFRTNVSIPSSLDIALLDIRLKSAQKCKIRLIPSGDNNTDDDTIVQFQTKGLNTMHIEKNVSNILPTFSGQIFRVVFIPASQHGGWTFEDADVTVKCDSCFKKADVLFVLEYYDTTSEDLFTTAVSFVQTFSTHVLKNFTENEAAFVIYHKNTYQEQFGFVKVSSLNAALFNVSAVLDGPGEEKSSDTVNYINQYFQNNARNDSQKIAIVMSQGNEDINECNGNFAANCTVYPTLSANLQVGKKSGIQYISVELGNVNHLGKDVLCTIADSPTNSHCFHGYDQISDTSTVPHKDVAMHIYEAFCFAYHKNQKYNEVRFGVVTAQILNDTSNEWQRSEEIQMTSMESSRIVFKSHFLGTFGTNVFVIVPELINFNEVFTNFAEKVADSPYVLAVNVSLLVLMVILMIILHWFDAQDQWRYMPMKYNAKNPARTYFISLHTGFWSSRKLTAIPYIILKGLCGETKARPIIDGRRENFHRWTVSNFIMTTEEDIGDLQEIKIWHDCGGKSTKWYLEKILITEGESRYVFFCGQWLSTSSGDGKTFRRLFPAATEMKDGRVLFSSVARFKFFDDYLLLSLFGRPAFSRFTRVQRLMCIMSLLFLSMLCNAMWFNTDEGTNSYGIEIGPLKITYKEFFVGLASSIITFPPALLLTFIFRKRKFKDMNHEEDFYLNDYDADKPIVPWWFIFIAYAIAILAIGCGATLTFFYSLQWGETVSTEWLTAFVMGTSQGIIILEPAKVVLVSTLLACLFKGSAQKEVKNMAPTDYIYSGSEFDENFDENDISYSTWPGDDNSSIALSRARRKSVLDRKLYDILYKIFIQILYITILSIICGHNAVTQSYHQNRFLKKTLSPVAKINNTNDMWDWLMDQYVREMYPKRFPNRNVRFMKDRTFMNDDIHYRVGLSRLRQQRVKGSCDINRYMETLVERCYPTLEDETQDTTNYCPGWTTYKSFCKNSGFTYTNNEDGYLFPFLGVSGIYDNKGYTMNLDPTETDVRNTMFKLQKQNWTDGRTRLAVIESTVFNMNTQLFSFIAVYFEFPSQGGVFSTFKVETARLYPYIDTFDYIVLGLQLLFLFITLYRFLYIFFDLWNMGSKCCQSVDAWLKVLSVTVSLLAIAFYAARIERTMYTVQSVFNNKDKFVTFELVNNLDYLYKVFIATELFIAILLLLKPLTLNFYLYLMRTSIAISISDLSQFTFFLMICMTGYALGFWLALGSNSADFRDLSTSYISLFRTLLSLVKFKEAFGSDISTVFGQIAFTFFIFSMGMVVLNFFIAILNDAFADVRSFGEKNNNDANPQDIPRFDRTLNKHLWRKLFFTLAVLERTFIKQERKDDYLPDENNVCANSLKLDTLVFKICDRVLSTDKSDTVFTKACLKFYENP